jgi:hypothetical protein
VTLRALAEADLAKILEDEIAGFGHPITLTNPEGVSATLVGYATDISLVIDPDTGQAVSGRTASIELRISSLTAAGLELPQGVADGASKPWVVECDDVNGVGHVYKVVKSSPDRSLGVVMCGLELYAPL